MCVTKNLKMGVFLGYPGGPNITKRVLIRRGQEGESQKKGVMTGGEGQILRET